LTTNDIEDPPAHVKYDLAIPVVDLTPTEFEQLKARALNR
jgi:hypothetical protein